MATSYSARSGLSKSWRPVKTHAGVYTGGKVELFERGGAALIACMLHDDVALVDAATGELRRALQQDVEDVRVQAAVGWRYQEFGSLNVLLAMTMCRRSRRRRSWRSPCVRGATSW